MQELMKFIYDMISEREFEVFTKALLQEMQYKVDEFVRTNYPLIADGKYVTLKFNEYNQLDVILDKNFEPEVTKFYPEKMI